MTDADALSASYAEGSRAGRAALLRDLGELRDEWRDEGEDFEINESQAADRLTAIIDRHAKDASEQTVLATPEEIAAIPPEDVFDWIALQQAKVQQPTGPDLRAMVEAIEHSLICSGCHACGKHFTELLGALRAATEPKAAAPAAPKEEERWTCENCGTPCPKCEAVRLAGTYERRKGGEG